MKKTPTILLLLFMCIVCNAQTFAVNPEVFGAKVFQIKAQVRDSLSNEGLSFASAYLKHKGDTLITDFVLSDAEGKIELKDVTTGNYILTVEYLGYYRYQKEFYLRKNTDLGEIRMKPDMKTLDAATVSSAGKEVEFRRDTIIFNATLFKTGSNDNLAALLRRMPGVEIGDNGTVRVNGKEVDKITIEGKTFFMNDKSVALNNLPANIIEKITVVDKDSDVAQITGIKDVEKERVMDLQLKEEYKQGFFGNVMLSGGAAVAGKRKDDFLVTDKPIFNSSLLASLYDEKDQLTMVGSGQSNCSAEDMLVTVLSNNSAEELFTTLPEEGVHSKYLVGANLNTDRIRNVSSTLTATYKADRIDSHSYTDRETYQQAISDLRDKEEAYVNGTTEAVSLNGEFSSKDVKRMSFTFVPSFSLGTSTSSSTSSEDSSLGGIHSHSARNDGGSREKYLSAAGTLISSYKLSDKVNRRLGLIAGYSFNSGTGTSFDNREVIYSDSEILRQNLIYDNLRSSSSMNASLRYTEPLSSKWSLHFSERSDFSVRRKGKTASGMDAATNSIYTSSSKSTFNSHRMEALGQYSKSGTIMHLGITANVSENVNSSVHAGQRSITGKDDWIISVTPRIHAMTRSKNGRTNYMFDLQSQVQRPGSADMLSALNVMSPTRLSIGNTYLKPFSHQTGFLSINGSGKNGSSYSFTLVGNLNKNGVTNAIWYDSHSTMYSVPVNIKDPTGLVSVQTVLSGPVTKNGMLKYEVIGTVYNTIGNSYQSKGIQDRIDVSGFDYDTFMSAFWGDRNGSEFYSGRSGFQKSRTNSCMCDLNAYIKLYVNNLQLRASVNPTYNVSKYSLDPRADMNTLDMEYRLVCEYVTRHGFELSSKVKYTTYHGYRDMFNEPLCRWNFSVLKNIKAFTVGIYANDILNQARTKQQTWADNYSQYRLTNAIGRNILLSVKYNFGKMNAAQSQTAQQASIGMSL